MRALDFRTKLGRPAIWAPALVLFAHLLPPPMAGAHDNWISFEKFVDPLSREWCCDEHDCFTVALTDVRDVGRGFLVEGKFFVARERVLPSNDENYWACFNAEGTGAHDRPRGVRCFFAPMNT